MTHAERCQAESTRDVVFLLQWRYPDGSTWRTESVWLDRAEAEAFRKSREYEWPESRVYGVPSSGQLAELLRRDPTLPCEWISNDDDFGKVTSCGYLHFTDPDNSPAYFCPYCGRPIEIKEESP